MAIPKRPSAAAFPAQKTTTAPAPKTEQTVDGWDDCRRGHFIGLHGTGGAGKSTLAAMLPGKTLFIDARKLGTMVSRKNRELTDADIRKIADTYNAFADGTLTDQKGFCAVAATEDIAKQDYILTPGRYVGIEEQADDGEPFDDKMKRLTGELAGLFEKSHELEQEIREKLGAIGYEV